MDADHFEITKGRVGDRKEGKRKAEVAAARSPEIYYNNGSWENQGAPLMAHGFVT